MRQLALVLGFAIVTPSLALADEREPILLSPEVDPFPFATLGYGTQIGLRHPALHGVRIAVASFMVNVPDVIAEMGGNEGFDVKVRPSAAIYVLKYFSRAGDDGLCVGGAVRYLRWRYRHDDAPGEEALASEVSPEAIVGYQWHPLDNGLYLQPWLGLSIVLARDGERVVGGHEYDPLPVQPFFTVNVGWEISL